MAITIIKEEPIVISQEQYNRFMGEYKKAYGLYAGTPPLFETFVRKKLEDEKKLRALQHTLRGFG